MSETSPAMPTRFACRLTDRSVIAVSGQDAGHFLANLLTAGIESLPPGRGMPAALLTPQGKIIADMLVFNASDEEPLFLLETHLGLADDLTRRLLLYKLRSAVAIDRLGAEIGVAAIDAEVPADADGFYAFPDPRDSQLGMRLIGPVAALESRIGTDNPASGEADAYHRVRINLGFAECGKDYLALSLFPHEANLDQIGGVDFHKGCYIGQEVVSRMEHRGTARTRMMIVETSNGLNVMAGAECRVGEVLLGPCGECFGGRALVSLRLDRLETGMKAGEPVTLGGIPARVLAPRYAQFQLFDEIKFSTP